MIEYRVSVLRIMRVRTCAAAAAPSPFHPFLRLHNRKTFLLQNWAFCRNWFCSVSFLINVNDFLYMLRKIYGRTEGKKIVRKSKGRQELHRGPLWVQTNLLCSGYGGYKRFILSISLPVFYGLFSSLSWLQRCTAEEEQVTVSML